MHSGRSGRAERAGGELERRKGVKHDRAHQLHGRRRSGRSGRSSERSERRRAAVAACARSGSGLRSGRKRGRGHSGRRDFRRHLCRSHLHAKQGGCTASGRHQQRAPSADHRVKGGVAPGRRPRQVKLGGLGGSALLGGRGRARRGSERGHRLRRRRCPPRTTLAHPFGLLRRLLGVEASPLPSGVIDTIPQRLRVLFPERLRVVPHHSAICAVRQGQCCARVVVLRDW